MFAREQMEITPPECPLRRMERGYGEPKHRPAWALTPRRIVRRTVKNFRSAAFSRSETVQKSSRDAAALHQDGDLRALQLGQYER